MNKLAIDKYKNLLNDHDDRAHRVAAAARDLHAAVREGDPLYPTLDIIGGYMMLILDQEEGRRKNTDATKRNHDIDYIRRTVQRALEEGIDRAKREPR